MQVYAQRPEGVKHPGAGPLGSFEVPDKGAGN